MSQTPSQPRAAVGTVTWVDLTVADAPGIRDFYEAVVGWTPREVDMGDYADFQMLPPDSAASSDSATGSDSATDSDSATSSDSATDSDSATSSDSAASAGSAPVAPKPAAAAGICHARGGNAKLPPQWIIYVPVKDLARSVYACQHLGGKVLHRLSEHYVLIQDPAGAVMMIYQDESA